MELESRIKAYRLVAYSSVLFATLAVLTVSFSLLLVYHHVTNVQKNMRGGVSFCHLIAQQISGEVINLCVFTNSTRRVRQAGYETAENVDQPPALTEDNVTPAPPPPAEGATVAPAEGTSAVPAEGTLAALPEKKKLLRFQASKEVLLWKKLPLLLHHLCPQLVLHLLLLGNVPPAALEVHPDPQDRLEKLEQQERAERREYALSIAP